MHIFDWILNIPLYDVGKFYKLSEEVVDILEEISASKKLNKEIKKWTNDDTNWLNELLEESEC